MPLISENIYFLHRPIHKVMERLDRLDERWIER
jgi:hypothetical protein